MKARDRFIEGRRAAWGELATLLTHPEPLHRRTPEVISRVAALYRAVSADLMRARSIGCGPDVVHHLDALTAQAHSALYVPRPYRLGAARRLLLVEFPRTVRQNWRFFALANLLFWLPFGFGLVASLSTPQFATRVLPSETLEHMAESYAQGFASGRDGGTDAMMAGFYVSNNVGIAFRCFATGILFGVGSIFFLIYNGLVTGTMVGYVIRFGAGSNILTFVASHSPFELTALVISGAAGIQMGYALVSTGGLSRLGSLRRQAPSVAAQVFGAGAMLLVAAGIEAFWSPSSFPPSVKFAFGGAMTVVVVGFLGFGGRRGTRVGASA